jgi:hypothetical protein
MSHVARRTSHLHPICATESAAPPQEDSGSSSRWSPSRALGPRAAQHTTPHHTTACRRGGQLSQVANARSPSDQANAHYSLHQATRRPRTTDEGGTLPWPFWKEWLEEERRGKEEGRKAAPSASARVLVISLFLSPR